MRLLPIHPSSDPKRIALRAVTKGGAVSVELEEDYDRTPGVVWLTLEIESPGESIDLCGPITSAQFDELVVLLLRVQARARAAGVLPARPRSITSHLEIRSDGTDHLAG